MENYLWTRKMPLNKPPSRLPTIPWARHINQMSMPKFQMHEIVIYNNPLNPLHIHIHLHLHLQGNIPNSGHYIDASRTVTLSRQGLEDPLVIDVRDPNEVAEGKGGPPSAIPGSVAWNKLRNWKSWCWWFFRWVYVMLISKEHGEWDKTDVSIMEWWNNVFFWKGMERVLNIIKDGGLGMKCGNCGAVGHQLLFLGHNGDGIQ